MALVNQDNRQGHDIKHAELSDFRPTRDSNLEHCDYETVLSTTQLNSPIVIEVYQVYMCSSSVTNDAL